jgi:hypothetical protein
VTSYEGGNPCPAPIRFVVTEDGFAQQIDVKTIPLRAKTPERLGQLLITGVDDEVANEGL